MASMSLTKKAILGVSKSMPFYSSRLSSASLSTAYERAEGANAVAEARNENPRPSGDPMYEAKQDGLSMSNDAARDSPIKAEQDSEMVRDTAKDTMDGAWKAAQETSHKVGDGDGDDDAEHHTLGNQEGS